MIAARASENRTSGSILRFAACALAAVLTVASLLEPVSASAGSFSFRRVTPPSTPGNFHVTAVTTNSVSFSWTASRAGSSGNFVYVIFQSTGLQFNVGNGTSATITTVSPGATYSFYIEAVAGTEASAPSPEVTVTLPAPPPPPQITPEAPVISGASATPSSITVSWTEATPADEIAGYAVFVNGTNAFDFGVGAIGTNFYTSTEWMIFNLTPDTTYSIVVVAQSTTGEQAKSDPISVTTTIPPNTTPPTAPTNLTGGSDGGGEAIVSWNPSTSVNEPQSQIYYRIYVKGIHEVDADTIGQTTEVYVFPDGTGDPQPVYVVAVDQYGNVSAPSNTLMVDF
jgi:hypothetical protein